jgi:predicted O-methyltransferase YrrM
MTMGLDSVDADPSYRFTADWFSGHAENWRRYLGHLAGRAKLAFLEIGSFEGRATTWLLENILTHPTSRIDCVDTFLGSPEHLAMGIDLAGLEDRFDHNIRATGAARKVNKLNGRSGDCLRGLRPASYDFAYVDGSHSARDVLEDAVLCFGLLKLGGLMIFDDYDWHLLHDDPQHPKVAIDAFLAIYAKELIIHDVDYQVVVERTRSVPDR